MSDQRTRDQGSDGSTSRNQQKVRRRHTSSARHGSTANTAPLTPLLRSKLARGLLEEGWAPSPSSSQSKSFSKHAEASLPQINLDDISYMALGGSKSHSSSDRNVQRRRRAKRRAKRRAVSATATRKQASKSYGHRRKSPTKTRQVHLKVPTPVTTPRLERKERASTSRSKPTQSDSIVSPSYRRTRQPIIGWASSPSNQECSKQQEAPPAATQEEDVSSLAQLQNSLFQTQGSAKADLENRISTAAAHARRTHDFKELAGLLWAAKCKKLDVRTSKALQEGTDLANSFYAMERGREEAEKTLRNHVRKFKTRFSEANSEVADQRNLRELWPVVLQRSLYCDSRNFLTSSHNNSGGHGRADVALEEKSIEADIRPRYDLETCKQFALLWSEFGAPFPSAWTTESEGLQSAQDIAFDIVRRQQLVHRESFLVRSLNFATSILRRGKSWQYCKAHLSTRLLLDLDASNAALQTDFDSQSLLPATNVQADATEPNFLSELFQSCFASSILVPHLFRSENELATALHDISAIGYDNPGHRATSSTPHPSSQNDALHIGHYLQDTTWRVYSLEKLHEWLHRQNLWCTVSLRLSRRVAAALQDHVQIPKPAAFWNTSLDSNDPRVLDLFRFCDVLRLLRHSAVRMQAFVRCRLCRHGYVTRRDDVVNAVVRIQRIVRPHIFRRMDAAVMLQALFRGHMDRMQFFRWVAKLAEGRLEMAKLVQAIARCIMFQQQYTSELVEWNSAAVKLQAMVRGEWSRGRATFKRHWALKTRLHRLVQTHAQYFLTRRRRAANFIQRAVPLQLRRLRARRNNAAIVMQTFIQRIWLQRHLRASARVDRKDLIARRERAAKLSQAAFRRMRVRADPKLRELQRLSQDLISVCAVTVHVKDGPRLERAVEAAAKGGLPSHSAAMIAAQTVAAELRSKREAQNFALTNLKQLIRQSKATVDEVHRAVFYQEFPPRNSGIDPLDNWNTKITEYIQLLQDGVRHAIQDAGCPATESTISVCEIMAQRTLPKTQGEIDDCRVRREKCLSELRSLVKDAGSDESDVRALLGIDPDALSAAIANATALGLINQLSKSSSTTATAASERGDDTTVSSEVTQLVMRSNDILMRLSRLQVDQKRLRNRISHLMQHAKTHAAQHVPMRSDIRELKTECQNATEKFGIDDSDDVVSNAYDLVKRLEAQELAREEAERTLELLVQTLKNSTKDVAERVSELSQGLRDANSAGAVTKNSDVVQNATNTLRTWQVELKRRDQLDEELRLVLDNLRSLKGINKWFGNEDDSLRSLDAELAKHQVADAEDGVAVATKSSMLHKVAESLKMHIQDSRIRRQGMEQKLIVQLTKMEKSSRNVSPVAFAAVSKSISDAVVFMKSLVAAFGPNTKSKARGHMRQTSAGSIDTQNSTGQRPSSPKPGTRRGRRGSIGHESGADSLSTSADARPDESFDPTELLSWPAFTSAKARVEALAATAAKARDAMTTLESILKKAINRSLKEFTGENSVSSLEEFLQSPLNAPNSPSVDTFALKNEVLESSRVYERVKAAIDDSTGTLGEDSECVVEVREVISTLQAILDDYEAEMDRTTAVSDLFDLRQRVMDYFDRALRLQNIQRTNASENRRDVHKRNERYQRRLMHFVKTGQVDKVIDLAIKHDINIDGGLFLDKHSNAANQETADAFEATEYRIPPLLAAIINDNPRMVKTLLELGANPLLPGFVDLARQQLSGETATANRKADIAEGDNSSSPRPGSPTLKKALGRRKSTVSRAAMAAAISQLKQSTDDAKHVKKQPPRFALTSPLHLFAGTLSLKNKDQLFHLLNSAAMTAQSSGRLHDQSILDTTLPQGERVPIGSAAASPLVCALRCHNFDTALLLLDAQASIDACFRDADDMTALHLAARAGNRTIVAKITAQLLTIPPRQAVDILMSTSCNGWTALHFAVFEGSHSCAEQIIVSCLEQQHRLPSARVAESILSATAGPFHTVLDISILSGNTQLLMMMRQHGAKSGALSLHFSNTHKYTEMAAETMDHEPEPVDPLLAPAPHQMPSHHSTAFLGDFRLLRAIFGNFGKLDLSLLRKQGFDGNSFFEIVDAVHNFQKDKVQSQSFAELVDVSYAAALDNILEFRGLFQHLDRNGVGYLRLRHLRSWLTSHPSKAQPVRGSGLASYYSIVTINKLLAFFLFRVQAHFLGSRHVQMRNSRSRVDSGGEGELMRRRARSSSMNIASPRSLDGAESADDSSIMSPSGQQKVKRSRTYATAIGGAADNDFTLSLLLNDLSAVEADIQVDQDAFVQFCVHFLFLRLVVEGVGLEVRRDKEQVEALRRQRRLDNEAALAVAAAAGDVNEINDILEDAKHAATEARGTEADVAMDSITQIYDLDINKQVNDGNTPLFLAVMSRCVEAVEVLLEAKADPLAVREDDNFSVLMEATYLGDERVFNAVLHGAKKSAGDDIDKLVNHLCVAVVPDDSTVKETVLLAAACRGHDGMTQSLLGLFAEEGDGANAKQRDFARQLVNFVCDEVFDDDSDDDEGSEAVGQIQLHNKSQVNFPAPVVWVGVTQIADKLLKIHEQDEDGWVGLPSLLDPTAKLGVPDASASQLLQCASKILSVNGVDLEARGGPSNCTALESAVIDGVEPVVLELLHAKCNPNSFASQGTKPVFVHTGSPLMCAVLMNDLPIVQILLSQPDICLEVRLAPAWVSSASGCIDPHFPDEDAELMAGFNLLHVAAFMGHFSILRVLLDMMNQDAKTERTPEVVEAHQDDGFIRRFWPNNETLKRDGDDIVPEMNGSETRSGMIFAEILQTRWTLSEAKALELGKKEFYSSLQEQCDSLLSQRLWQMHDELGEDGFISEAELRDAMEQLGASAALGFVECDEAFALELDAQEAMGRIPPALADEAAVLDFDVALAVARRMQNMALRLTKRGLLDFWDDGESTAIMTQEDSALFRAAQAGNLGIVEQWLDRLQDSDDAKNLFFRLVDRSGFTIPMVAIYFEHNDIASRVISFAQSLSKDDRKQLAAHLNQTSNDGSTALVLASSTGCVEMVKLLLEVGRPSNGEETSLLSLNTPTQTGTTALYTATVEHQAEIMQLLLQAKSSPNAPTSEDGRLGLAPLHAAVADCRIDLVNILLSCETIDLEQVNAEQLTPLMTAVLLGNIEIVQALLNAGSKQRQATVSQDNDSSASGGKSGAVPPWISETMVAIVLGEQDILAELLPSCDQSFRTKDGDTADMLVMKLHGLSTDAFLSLELESVVRYAECETDEELMEMVNEEFGVMRSMGGLRGGSDTKTIENYLESYAFDIGDGTEVTVDQFYSEDLYAVLVVALTLRLRYCMAAQEAAELQAAQILFYKQMMRLIALWEMHSAMDHSGGDKQDILEELFKACEANHLENVVRYSNHDLVNVAEDCNSNGETAFLTSVYTVCNLYSSLCETSSTGSPRANFDGDLEAEVTRVPLMLLELKSDPNAKSHEGVNALMLASEYGVEPLVTQLLIQGGQLDSEDGAPAGESGTFRVDLDVVDPATGHSALGLAILHGHVEIMLGLMRAGAACVAGTRCNAMELALQAATSMHDSGDESAVEEATVVIEYLIGHPSIYTEAASECLPWVLWYTLLKSDFLMLENVLGMHESIDLHEDMQWLRHLRSTSGNEEVWKFVGVDVNAPPPKTMLAATTGFDQSLKVLQDRCTSQQWSPLYYSVATCDFEVTMILLKHGARVMQSRNIANQMHELHLSAQVGFFHTFKLIWDSCSDEERSSRSVAGQTPADIIESTFQVRFDNFLEFLDFSSPGVFECLSREDTSMAGSSFQSEDLVTKLSELCSACFNECESDGDGTIDQYEMTEYFRGMGVHTVVGPVFQSIVRFFFQGMDTDGNKRVSEAEFSAWFPKLLQFREMWIRCKYLRMEHPLMLHDTKVERTPDGRLVPQPVPTIAKIKAYAKQIEAMHQMALAEYSSNFTDPAQMDSADLAALTEELFVAAEEDDVALAAKVAALCGTVDLVSGNPDDGGYSPLMVACQRGSRMSAQALVQLKANVNFCSADGVRPIHLAIQSGDKVLVEILNDQRLFGRGEGSAVETANLNARLPEGQTALMLAAQIVSDDQSSSELGGSSCVEYLLSIEEYATADEINAFDDNGFSALHFAVSGGNTESVALICAHQFCNVDVKSSNEISASYLAVERGFNEALQHLLKAKADANAVSGDNVSLLYKVVERGDVQCLKLLLDAKASPNRSDQSRRECSVAMVVADFEILQMILGHLKEHDPSTFSAEFEGLGPGLMQRHGVSAQDVMEADFSAEAKQAATSHATPAQEEFETFAGSGATEISAEQQREWLDSMADWKNRFTEAEWENVVALCINRTQTVGGFANLESWSREYFRIQRILHEWDISGSASPPESKTNRAGK